MSLEEIKELHKILLRLDKTIEITSIYKVAVIYLSWAVIAPVGALLTAVVYGVLNINLWAHTIVITIWVCLVVFCFTMSRKLGGMYRIESIYIKEKDKVEEYLRKLKSNEMNELLIWILLYIIYVMVTMVIPYGTQYWSIVVTSGLCITIASGNLGKYVLLKRTKGKGRKEILLVALILYLISPIVGLVSLKAFYLGFMLFAAVVGLSYLCASAYLLSKFFKYVFLEGK